MAKRDSRTTAACPKAWKSADDRNEPVAGDQRPVRIIMEANEKRFGAIETE